MVKRGVGDQPSDLLVSGDDVQLSPDKVKEIKDVLGGRIADIINREVTGENMEVATDTLLAEYVNIVGRVESLQELEERLTSLIESLQSRHSTEVQGYDDEIREKKRELAPVNQKRMLLKSAVLGVYTVIAVGITGIGYKIYDGLTTSDAERVEMVEKNTVRSTHMKQIFTQLGIHIDQDFQVGDIYFTRKNHKIAFSDLELYEDDGKYVFTGNSGDQKISIIFPYYAPNMVGVQVGETETTLFNPNMQEIEAFIQAKIALLELERMKKVQAATDTEAEKARAAAQKENDALAQKSAEEASQRAEEEKRVAIITSKKEGIRGVIARLSGDENATITTPFSLEIPWDDTTVVFEMTPKLGTGELNDADYLKEGKVFKITSGKLEIQTEDGKNYIYQIEMSIEADSPNYINIIEINSTGVDGPVKKGEVKDFNGQDVTVFKKYLENYIAGKL